MSIEGRRMTINGLSLNVLIQGEGDPVLLLHGFPDSNFLWRGVIPRLVEAGYRVIAPDQRGFGLSDAPEGVEHYDMDLIASDAIAILDELGIEKAKLVAHDWGAMIGWLLAGTYPDRFESYIAISVGHPKAYASAGFEQKRKGWYVLFFQLRGIAEKAFMADDWSIFRKTVEDHPELDHWIEDLSRPGRLTAGMDWYRANLSKLWKGEFPRVKIPVFGIWSTGDVALAEDQMIGSAAYVDASWQYERLEDISHWVPVDAPDTLSNLIISYYLQREAAE
ncbi:MAG: alpha/beta fold hydrolase [Longimicrobiales bacterium]